MTSDRSGTKFINVNPSPSQTQLSAVKGSRDGTNDMSHLSGFHGRNASLTSLKSLKEENNLTRIFQVKKSKDEQVLKMHNRLQFL